MKSKNPNLCDNRHMITIEKISIYKYIYIYESYIYIYIFKQTKYYQRQLFNDDPYLQIYSPNILPNKSIKGNYKSYNPNSKRCSLYLHEKLEIVDHPKEIF